MYTSLYLQIPLPESVTGRYDHSLTAVTMSPHCVWLVIVGGYEEFEWKDVGGGKKVPRSTPITDTNRLIMIIELGKIILINCKDMSIKYIKYNVSLIFIVCTLFVNFSS